MFVIFDGYAHFSDMPRQKLIQSPDVECLLFLHKFVTLQVHLVLSNK